MDTANHLLLDCTKYEEIRDKLTTEIVARGVDWPPINLISLVNNPDTFRTMTEFCKEAIHIKTEEEQLRELV